MILVITNCIKTAQNNISDWVEYWDKESSDLLSNIKNNFSDLLSDWVVDQFSFDHSIAVNFVIISFSLSPLIHSHQALFSVSSASEQMQSYLISSEVKTVEQLWHEWHVGLGDQSVIKDLNEKWGSRWWKATSQSNKQAYSHWKKVVNYIRVIADEDSDAETVMQSLNLLQTNNRWATLNSVFTYLNKMSPLVKKRKHGLWTFHCFVCEFSSRNSDNDEVMLLLHSLLELNCFLTLRVHA